MGNRIIISEATYLNDIKTELLAVFDVKSDHVTDVSYSAISNTLSFRQNGAVGLFETLANKIAKSATVTADIASTSGVQSSVVIGILADGNFILLYLEGSGLVRKFWKDGHVDAVTLLTMPTPRPTVAKGSPVTITHSSDRVTISYPGYSNYILYSSIPNFSYPVIGVMATANSIHSYGFVINS